MDYKIIERKEILNEYAANLLGMFNNIIIKKRIEDKENPLIIISNQIAKIKKKIIGSGSKSLEELNVIEVQLNVFKNLLQEMNK